MNWVLLAVDANNNGFLSALPKGWETAALVGFIGLFLIYLLLKRLVL